MIRINRMNLASAFRPKLARSNSKAGKRIKRALMRVLKCGVRHMKLNIRILQIRPTFYEATNDTRRLGKRAFSEESIFQGISSEFAAEAGDAQKEPPELEV